MNAVCGCLVSPTYTSGLGKLDQIPTWVTDRPAIEELLHSELEASVGASAIPEALTDCIGRIIHADRLHAFVLVNTVLDRNFRSATLLVLHQSTEVGTQRFQKST